MKTFKTVDEYIPTAKENDIIVFGGRGIMDGIKNIGSKHDTYKVKKADAEKLLVKAYRGKSCLRLDANAYNQELVLLTNKEYKELPVLW